MAEKPCLVAGGGIAGLAAAIALARAGKTVRVFEQAPAFEEVGAGIQISPNAVRALQHLGAWDAVAPHCLAPDAIVIRDDKRVLKTLSLGYRFEQRFGAPYRIAHRAGLLKGLLETAMSYPSITLETATPVAGVDGASLRFANGQSVDGALVVAADGINSRIRQSLFGPAWVESCEVFRTLEERRVDPVVTLWLCRGGHAVHYPLPNGKVNRVAVGTGRSLFPEVHWQSWTAGALAPLRAWSKGSAVLVGDAAHATLPYLAQGAAMALEDACALAKYGHENLYRVRAARTGRLWRETRKLTRVYHATGALRLARDAAIAGLPELLFWQRQAWIYGWRP